MATIVNNPTSERERVVESSDTGGWAVAVIVLLAVLAIGGFLWMRYYSAPAAAPTQNEGGANINVTLPANNDTGGSNSGSSDQPVTNPAQ